MSNYLSYLRNYYKDNSQITYLDTSNYLLIYNSQMVDKNLLYLSLIPSLTSLSLENLNYPFTYLNKENFETLNKEIYSGSILIYSKNNALLASINLASFTNRSPESAETFLGGSKDNLIENLQINLSLIYKRIKSQKLKHLDYQIGSLTKTKVSLLYIEDKASEKLKDYLDNILKNLRVENLTSLSQLKYYLTNKRSIMPHFNYVDKVDLICEALIDKKIVFLIDNIPYSLILPLSLFNFTSHEDIIHTSEVFTLFSKFYSFIGLFLSIFLLGFYASIITLEPDLIPYSFLINIYNSFKGISLGSKEEIIICYLFFQICYFVSTKSLNGLSSAILTIGSLLIGQISVSSGLISQVTLIITAISFLATFLVSNSLILNNSLFALKLFILAFSLAFNFLGFLISSLIVLIYLSSLEKFEMPYLFPFTSLNPKNYFKYFIKPQKEEK